MRLAAYAGVSWTTQMLGLHTDYSRLPQSLRLASSSKPSTKDPTSTPLVSIFHKVMPVEWCVSPDHRLDVWLTKNKDSLQSSPPHHIRTHAGTSKGHLWTITGYRAGTTMGQGLVRSNGDCSGNDHIQRRGWDMVLRYVRGTIGREGMAVDKRGARRGARATASDKSKTLPRPPHNLTRYFRGFRHSHVTILCQHTSGAATTWDDGHVCF